MKIIRPLLYLLLIVVMAFAAFLIYATIDDYIPVTVELLHDENEMPDLSDSSDLKVLIWNIGYA